MTEPKLGPPQGLKLLLDSGATVPCDTKFVGTFDDAEVYIPVLEYDLDKLMGQVVNIHVDYLPERVCISLPAGPNGEPTPMTCGNRPVRTAARVGNWRTAGIR